uniref:Uncharacterized protein n=1 Tax=Romanomermis culicivorax TaxID=13658 RepID=A0A915HPV8_ROMCU
MYNNQWKLVRILTKSEFVLEMNWLGKLEMKPVQKTVDPLNPVVILDTNTVEYGYTIFFKDCVLINYDSVRVSKSILVVTKLASNTMKGFLLNAQTVPFLTVAIKKGTQFDSDKLDEKRIISLNDFKSKIETLNECMKQKPFIFRHSRLHNDEFV